MQKSTKSASEIAYGVTIPSLEAGLRAYTLEDEERYYLVGWNGHEFEPVAVKGTHYGDTNFYFDYDNRNDLTIETVMVWHYPIDPRTKLSDWRRATRAKGNETNTGWLPDWDADYHHDHESRPVSYTHLTLPTNREV